MDVQVRKVDGMLRVNLKASSAEIIDPRAGIVICRMGAPKDLMVERALVMKRSEGGNALEAQEDIAVTDLPTGEFGVVIQYNCESEAEFAGSVSL